MSPIVIIIPTHGDGDDARATLTSLSRCELPQNYRRCYLVENGPQAGAEALAMEFARTCPALNLVYLHVAWANKSNALNQALAKVPPETLVIFFDNDVIVEADTLRHYANADADEHRSIHRPSPVYGGTLKIKAIGQAAPYLRKLMPASLTGNVGQQHSFFLGANWAAYASDILAVGGFDPAFGPGSEIDASGDESMLMRALRKHGCQFRFIPEAVVHHHVDFDAITLEALLWRRTGNGAERGLRFNRQYQQAGVCYRIVLLGKVALSKALAIWYKGLAKIPTSASLHAYWQCRSRYHHGLLKGWKGH